MKVAREHHMGHRGTANITTREENLKTWDINIKLEKG